MTQVNRYLKDKAMDRIDHALGRPVDPLAKTYRNYFATDTWGDLASGMAASPHWRLYGTDGSMDYYAVTRQGRAALKAHLQDIGDQHRLYAVNYDDYSHSVVATSHGKARYRAWLDVSDCHDISFRNFQRISRVHLVGGRAAA